MRCLGYLISLVLVLAGTAAGAYLGMFGRHTAAAPDRYYAEGLVRVARVLPRALADDAVRPDHQEHMEDQLVLVKSRRVIDMALQDPLWKASGVAPDPAAMAAALARDLEVKPVGGSLIRIGFRHENAHAAAAGVAAVVSAYAELYRSSQRATERTRTGVLEDRQEFLRKRQEGLALRLYDLTAAYGTDAVGPAYAAAVGRLDRLRTGLADVRLAEATEPPEPAAADPAAGPGTRPAARPTPAARRRAALAELIAEAQDEVVRVGRLDLEARRLKDELAGLADQAKVLTDRVESLRADRSLDRDLTVISSGEVPTETAADPAGRRGDRSGARPMLRGAAAGGGAVAGVLLVVRLLVGFAGRKRT